MEGVDEGLIELKIQEVSEMINENPYEILLYQQLIELYRKIGNIDDLRIVLDRVHSLYCLPVDMWLEWIEYEERIQLSEDPIPQKAINSIIALFERAVHDYRYYKVCRRYCKFMLRHYHHGRRVSVQAVRDVHEFVLQIYGLDVNRSIKFWDPYLKFEQDILKEMQDEGEERDKQV